MSDTAEIVADTLSRTLGIRVAPDGDLIRADTPAWDSLRAIEIILALESASGVEFEPEEIASAGSQSELVALIAAKQTGT